MIPIQAGATLDVVRDGDTYKLRYLTEGEHIGKYMEIDRKQSAVRDALRAQAVAECPGSDQSVIDATYERLRISRARAEVAEESEVSDMYIDTFLAGWEGIGLPPFPTDGRPSRCFRLCDKNKVVGMIIDNLGELLGFSVDEVKNS